MHLKAYLADKPRGTAADIARKAGLSHAALSRLAADLRWPNREAWQRIVEATDGQVTPNDHLGTTDRGDVANAS